MWILPEMDIFSRNHFFKLYRGCQPDNIPELCKLYSCLNRDLQKAVDFHVRYTHSLHKLDPKRFSITTPKKGTLAYLSMFDQIAGVAPSSKRIIYETYNVIT